MYINISLGIETLKVTRSSVIQRAFSTAPVIRRAAVILVFPLPALTNWIVLRFWQLRTAAVALTKPKYPD